MNIKLYNEYMEVLEAINKELENENLPYEESYSLKCQKKMLEVSLAKMVDDWLFED